mmetsp:Transcript_34433/g.103788  ORF Transcript_34433/g.103788 Transcript_34433/m.103788 type:complete len:97 (+) Transcript_34433:7-297(+)
MCSWRVFPDSPRIFGDCTMHRQRTHGRHWPVDTAGCWWLLMKLPIACSHVEGVQSQFLVLLRLGALAVLAMQLLAPQPQPPTSSANSTRRRLHATC